MPLGPGDGVPTSIKDAWTRGWPTLRGSSLIDAAGPEEDALCVAQLRKPAVCSKDHDTGVLVEASPIRRDVTGNPGHRKTSGGSSGGSASGGARHGTVVVGTDGGGFSAYSCAPGTVAGNRPTA